MQEGGGGAASPPMATPPGESSPRGGPQDSQKVDSQYVQDLMAGVPQFAAGSPELPAYASAVGHQTLPIQSEPGILIKWRPDIGKPCITIKMASQNSFLINTFQNVHIANLSLLNLPPFCKGGVVVKQIATFTSKGIVEGAADHLP